MEAKFKVGDVIAWSESNKWWRNSKITKVDLETRRYFVTDPLGGEGAFPFSWDVELVTPVQPAITIGSTWYWQGEKDSPVTVIGFDSKGRVVVESGFEDKDGDPVYFGEVFSYGGNAGIEGTDMFLEAYQPTIKPKKITGYVRVLKPAEGFLVNDKSDEYIFQSAVFSDEAKARAAVPYGFEVVDVVKVEWE